MADDTANGVSFSQVNSSQDINESGQLQSVTEQIVHEANGGSHLHTLPMRHELISTAVTFLKDVRAASHSIDQKKDFLLKKGLNSSEIDLALSIAESQASHGLQVQQFHQTSALQTNPSMPYYPFSQGPIYPSGLQMIRSLVPPLVIAYGTIYGVYLLYKKYIEPRLFGPPKKHPLYLIIESVTKLQESMNAIQESLDKMEDNIVSKLVVHITNYNQIASSERLAACDLKKELASLKALLLGRNNFPETPYISSVSKKIADGSSSVNASIPSWQLAVEGEKERQ